MKEQQTSIAQDIEHLIKKTADANNAFISESARFIKRLSASDIKGEDLVSTQKQLIKDAVTLFIKLNIQHASNLIDLGVAITQRLNEPFDVKQDDAFQEKDRSAESKRAFVLNVTAAAGTTAITQFLLDSDKKEPVWCTLKQTDYLLQNDPVVNAVFETTFLPQSFQLLFGKPQKVEIHVKIPDDAKEGIYLSNIQVHGFEHTFFSLYLTVTAKMDSINKSSQ